MQTEHKNKQNLCDFLRPYIIKNCQILGAWPLAPSGSATNRLQHVSNSHDHKTDFIRLSVIVAYVHHNAYLPITKSVTSDSSIDVSEAVITDSSPSTVMIDFQTSL